VRDLGCAFVDDMLAQSRWVALRKMVVTGAGMTLFFRVHEREGTYTADSREGGTNVGLRVEQLAGLGLQLGLLATAEAGPATAHRGAPPRDTG
jgi:hypothetical protein